MNRPLIAVTCSDFQSIFVKLTLKLAVFLAGGRALLVSKKHDDKELAFDGLLLAGGVDINPELYSGELKENYRYDFLRDELELSLLEKAYADNLPILAICRGCQLLNIYKSGTLYKDVLMVDRAAKYPSRLLGYMFFRKKVTVVRDSLLFSCIKITKAKVNSIHKQCIDRLGEGMVVSSSEHNGIIQSIEDNSNAFVLGVQFHPEFLIYQKKYLNIFKQFIKQCQRK